MKLEDLTDLLESFQHLEVKNPDGSIELSEGACCDECKGDLMITEAQYQGKTVSLNSPFRTPSGPRKFSVYVKNSQGNIVKVNFGDPNNKIRNDDPGRAKSFQARHNCAQKTDRTTAGWWSCNVARYSKKLGLSSSRPW